MMNLLLLHGAIGSSQQLEPLSKALSEQYAVHTLNFSGHGGNEISDDDFSIQLFAADVINWMNENKISCINIFGYSMGGYVALYLACNHPERVGKVFTLATKFDWTPEIAQSEIKLLNPEKIIEKLPAFAETLAKRHAPSDWKMVLKKTTQMMLNLGAKNSLSENNFKHLKHNITLSVGDGDKMVSVEETESIAKKIEHASLIVFPNTPHPIEAIDLNQLTLALKNFFV